MNGFLWMKRALVAAFATVALCGANVAAAAVDMFLKLDGIPGESTDKTHKDEIVIVSFGWEIAPRLGDAAGRTSKPCAHDISFVKNVDKASPLLATHAILGTIIPKALLSVRKAGEAQQDFMTIELNSVLVSSVSHSVNSSSIPLETFTLNFASATFSFKPQRADGELLPAIIGQVSRSC